MRYLLLALILGLQIAALNAQQRPEIDIQEFADLLFQSPDQDLNYDDLYESLYQLYTSPIDLNRATLDDLRQLFMLTPHQINVLHQYLTDHRPVLSLYELQTIDALTMQDIQRIIPFVVVQADVFQTKGRLLERIAHEENNFLLVRHEAQSERVRGLKEPDSVGFLGSSGKTYVRYRVSHSGDFSLGLTAEKDNGESFAWRPSSNQYGADFYSFHFMLENKKRIKRFVVGDYQMQFGQGLVLGSGFNPGKGGETITTIHRANTGIRPYTSVLETGYMRGLGVTYSVSKSILFSPFFSILRQDGMVRQSLDSISYISSLQSSGFHRTQQELNAKNQVIEQNFGFNLTYRPANHQQLTTGVTYIATYYDIPIQRTPNSYNQFEFNGDRNYTLGAFANYNWQNFLFFGEGAQSRSGGIGIVGGLLGSLTDALSMSFLARKYDQDCHSFYGNSFGEGSRAINEQGLYWGLKYQPLRKLIISGYYDKFSFPWLRSTISAPSEGNEYLLRASISPSKRIEAFIQFRQEIKEKNNTTAAEAPWPIISTSVKRNYVSQLDLTVNEHLVLRSRLQHSTYHFTDEQTTGTAILQDVIIKWSRFKLSGRTALFDTEDYENRQYVYEKDVLYAFSIPAYYGVGTRNYLLLQYNAGSKLSIWIKAGQYRYRNQENIGTGLSSIAGNKKSELKVQLRFKM